MEKVIFLQNKSSQPDKVFEECGHEPCKKRDITPGLTSAEMIDGKWYHNEKHRPCAQEKRKEMQRSGK